jgi:hypothetical protein
VSNLYEYPLGFGVAIISMPSSSNLVAADNTDEFIGLCVCGGGIVFADAAVAFPNKLLINPARVLIALNNLHLC